MNNSHEGRVAIVTGAAQGIGRQIAVTLALRGAQLVLMDIEDMSETAAMIGERCVTVVANVSSDQDWADAAACVMDTYGRADIVVNNAGIYPRSKIDELTYDLWRHVMSVNLDSTFLSAKHFVPLMRKNKWGRFVNVASNSIGTPAIGLSHYMASKMGVIGFVRGLANDTAEDGITVNAVLPAYTATPGTAGGSDETRKLMLATQAIKRLAVPDDIVGPVAFLTSDDAAFITGQSIVVDGGMYKIT